MAAIDDNDDDERELEQLARAVRERLLWLARGGVAALPKGRPLPPAPTRPAAPIERPTAPIERPAVTIASPSRIVLPVSPDGFGAVGLRVVQDDLGDCHRCKLSAGRTKIVFGTGNPEASLVFVGEAPGSEEDRSGEPFVGAAGQLLTKMIAAMGLSREEVYIANIIKCRPPENRKPEPDELSACEPFLMRQLAAIKPRLLVALGGVATKALLGTERGIMSLRGEWKSFEGIPLMPTLHPAYVLREPSSKREVWNDLKLVMAEMDRLGIARRPMPPRGA